MASLKKLQYDSEIVVAGSYYDLNVKQKFELHRWMQSNPGVEMGIMIGGGGGEAMLRHYKANANDFKKWEA
jgi:hypothetical protein